MTAAIGAISMVVGIILFAMSFAAGPKSARQGEKFFRRSERKEKKLRKREKDDLGDMYSDEKDIEKGVNAEGHDTDEIESEEKELNHLIDAFERDPKKLYSELKNRLEEEKKEFLKSIGHARYTLDKEKDEKKTSEKIEEEIEKEARLHLSEKHRDKKYLTDEELKEIRKELKLEKKEHDEIKEDLKDEKKMEKITKLLIHHLHNFLEVISEQIKIMNKDIGALEAVSELRKLQHEKEKYEDEFLDEFGKVKDLESDLSNSLNYLAKLERRDNRTGKKAIKSSKEGLTLRDLDR